MIAPKRLPAPYADWNRRQGAPFGRNIRFGGVLQKIVPASFYQKWRGPFAIQPNNTTREFEYPWAFHATPLSRGMSVLEIGGGLGGFQFALSRAGCRVVNVDPGLQAEGLGWKCDVATIQALNRCFATSVQLFQTTMEKAGLQADSFDRIFSISVIEHLAPEELAGVMKEAHRVLRPGGSFVLTVDLSLNLSPFTSRSTNQFGRNVNLKELVSNAPFLLEQGNPEELYGFPGFSADRIQSNLENYFVGSYPVLVQCFVLKKAG